MAASGVLGILMGVAALFFPGVAILTAAVLLGIGLLVQGVLEIAAAVRAGSGTRGRGWLIAFGVLALVAGILVLASPAGGILVLAYGLILWFLVAGINDLIAGASNREGRIWNITIGVISVLAALLLLVFPVTAIGLLAVVIALGFLFRGAAQLALAAALHARR